MQLIGIGVIKISTKGVINKLPKFDNQIYLQGTSKDMDPIEPTTGKNYLIVDE